MISLNVPVGTPLVLAVHATRCFVVVNGEGLMSGVYPSVERALAYITDWVVADERVLLTPIEAKVNPVVYGSFVVLVNGEVEYRIEETHFRI